MTLGDHIIETLRGNQPGSITPDRRTARTQLMSLSRTLGGQVIDQTDYVSGRTYRFFHPVRAIGEGQSGIILHVVLSAAGPYATHTFRQTLAPDRWWGSTVRISRTGFGPEDLATLERLRTFYQEHGYNEVDVFTQAVEAPPDLTPPQRRRGAESTSLYDVLFHQ